MKLYMDCIFCKIIEGELPSYKVYEDKRVLAFLDINPVNKGHVLVVPKEHFNKFTDAPKDLLKDMISVIQNISLGVMDAVGAEGFNLGINNGAVAGQIVHHLHFHIMPRFENDGLNLWTGKTLTEEEMKRTAENIRRSLAKDY